jgi:hypothetical protein
MHLIFFFFFLCSPSRISFAAPSLLYIEKGHPFLLHHSMSRLALRVSIGPGRLMRWYPDYSTCNEGRMDSRQGKNIPLVQYSVCVPVLLDKVVNEATHAIDALARGHAGNLLPRQVAQHVCRADPDAQLVDLESAGVGDGVQPLCMGNCKSS